MRGVNKVILVGTLGGDPEIRHTPSGDAVASLSIATNESWVDKKTGEKQERTEWHKVILWRRLAEIAQQYLTKGSKVFIEGKLQTRKWEKDGVERYTTEIIGDSLQLLGDAQSGGRPQQGNQGNQGNQPSRSPATESSRDQGSWDDDVPF